MKKINFEIKKGIIPGIIFGDINNSKKIVIHLNISNGIKELSRFFNLPNLPETTFLIIDLPGHGECKINPTKNWNFYTKIVKNLILKIKNDYKNIKNFYLEGESFGADLAILFTKKYPNLVKKVILINPPFSVKNPKVTKDNKKTDSFLNLSWKYVLTYLFNLSTFSNPYGIEELTKNQLFLRLNQIANTNSKQNNMINIAAWQAMYPARKYIVKHFKKNYFPPLYLIQTIEDFYYDKNIKYIKKIKKTHSDFNKLILLEKGDHILTIDQQNNIKLWKILLEVIE